MKTLVRRYYDVVEKQYKVGVFVNNGVWGDGHLSYCLVAEYDNNGNELQDYEKTQFAQVRGNKGLEMVMI